MRGLRIRPLSAPSLLFDIGLALLLWAVGAVQLLSEPGGPFGRGGGPPGGPRPGGGPQPPAPPDELSYVLLGLCAGSLAVRRQNPLLSLAGVTLFGAAFLVRGEPVFTVQLVALVAIYTAVADSNLARLQAIAVCVMAAAILAAAIYLNDDPRTDAVWAMDAAWVIAAIFLGDSVRSRREIALQAERMREEEARRRVSEERVQVARELHDVVGHRIALINVQAGAGSHVLYKDPDQARETFNNIRGASHETLQELRSLVGVLREPLTGEPLAPAVGLDGLDQLIKSVAEAGQKVKLTVSGGKRQIGGIVDLSAYRILQEALTNTVRHAPKALVDVRLTYSDSELSLDVSNGPGEEATQPDPGGGHGLAGMRERVLALGGRLDAGPDPGGGFHVRAVLPAGPSA
jgi:signal transduction histidine kinase